jgi:hypothetical protein
MKACFEEHICHDRLDDDYCAGTLIIDWRYHPSKGWKRFWTCDVCNLEYSESEIVELLEEEAAKSDDEVAKERQAHLLTEAFLYNRDYHNN